MMTLTIKNIGKLHEECAIDLNGITVVAGENSTGKSTIGKALYAITHSFHNIDEHITSDRRSLIYKRLEAIPSSKHGDMAVESAVNEIINNPDVYQSPKEVYNLLKDKFIIPDAVDIKWFSEQISEVLQVSDESILNHTIYSFFSKEFGNNIICANHKDELATVSIESDNKDISVELSGAKAKTVHRADFYRDVTYIDDPFVLDELVDNVIYKSNVTGHRNDLIYKLRGTSDPGIIEKIITNNKIEKIMSMVEGITHGHIKKSSTGRFVYASSDLDTDLDIVDMSTGMKNFVVLRTLLENGSIEENSIVILDEPEIHLHPEWQIVLAELLVLLHKEFGLTILLNTHSPYFLNAVETYGDIHGCKDSLRFYFSENKGVNSVIHDVTGNTDEIYKSLAEPFQKLEDMSYHDK